MLKIAKFVEQGGRELQDRVKIIERSGAVIILVADVGIVLARKVRA
jgi:hypothetical protein